MDTKPLDLDETIQDLLTHLWRKGNFAYYWRPGRNGMASHSQWFAIKQPLPGPVIAKNICQYFGVHPCLEIPKTNAKGKATVQQFVRAQIKYIHAASCLFGEYDYKTMGGQQATIQHIKQLPLQPSVVIFSGGGLHVYFLLDEPFLAYNKAQRNYLAVVQKQWVQFIGSDPASSDLARVLRLMGTRNYKKAYAPNYPLVKFVKADFSLQYSIFELDLLSRQAPKTAAAPPPQPPFNGTVAEFVQAKCQIASRMIAGAEDGTKRETLLRASILLGGVVVTGTLDEEEARGILREAIEARPTVENLDDAYSTIEAGLTFGKERPLSMPQHQSP